MATCSACQPALCVLFVRSPVKRCPSLSKQPSILVSRCSNGAAPRCSKLSRRRWHDRPTGAHDLLETGYQRELADRTHPEGHRRLLDRIGLLSPRLTLAHCTWARRTSRADRRTRRHDRRQHQLESRPEVWSCAGGGDVRLGCRVAMGWTAWPSTRTTTRCVTCAWPMYCTAGNHPWESRGAFKL